MLKTVARSMNRTLWRGVLAWILFGFGTGSQFELAIAGQIECVQDTPVQDTPNVLTCDHRVPHKSTVPANKDELVELFVRERVKDSGKEPPKVVLMIHGLSVPVLAGFELRTDHYDWALWLAQAGGFDVFMLDFQGSVRSPRPMMDDPCNVNPAQRSILIPNPLSDPFQCPSQTEASYPFQLINSKSDWDELDTVVDYIRNLRGVDKVALVSWSQGSFRVGPYAIQHPDKVESVLFFAPIFNPGGRASKAGTRFDSPAALPVSSPPAQFGFPMNLTTRTALMNSWGIELGCEGQREEGIQDFVWSSIMDNDTIGRNWGPVLPDASVEGVMRVRNPFLWGWTEPSAGRCPCSSSTASSTSKYQQLRSLFRPSTTTFRAVISCRSKSSARDTSWSGKSSAGCCIIFPRSGSSTAQSKGSPTVASLSTRRGISSRSRSMVSPNPKG